MFNKLIIFFLFFYCVLTSSLVYCNSRSKWVLCVWCMYALQPLSLILTVSARITSVCCVCSRLRYIHTYLVRFFVFSVWQLWHTVQIEVSKANSLPRWRNIEFRFYLEFWWSNFLFNEFLWGKCVIVEKKEIENWRYPIQPLCTENMHRK